MFKHAAVARTHLKVKMIKHAILGPLLEVELLQVKMYKTHQLAEKVHALVPRSTFPSQNGTSTTFGRSDVVSRGRRKGMCTLSKVSKT
jgi:hypothetical protein